MKKYTLVDWEARHGGPSRRDYFGDWRTVMPQRLAVGAVLLVLLGLLWFGGWLTDANGAFLASWGLGGLLASGAVIVPLSSKWRHLGMSWRGDGRLAVRLTNPWPTQANWSSEEIGGIVFGVREQVTYRGNGKRDHQGWFWFVHLVGKPGSATDSVPDLVEFVVDHQPTHTGNQRERIPHRTKELVTWLKRSIECPVRGPVVVKATARKSRL